MTSLRDIIAAAKEELTETFSQDDIYPEDRVHEIADSSVPVYTYELTQLASDSDIAFHENELPPAFDGTPTIANIVATAIYELVSEALYQALYELQEVQAEAS